MFECSGMLMLTLLWTEEASLMISQMSLCSWCFNRDVSSASGSHSYPVLTPYLMQTSKLGFFFCINFLSAITKVHFSISLWLYHDQKSNLFNFILHYWPPSKHLSIFNSATNHNQIRHHSRSHCNLIVLYTDFTDIFIQSSSLHSRSQLNQLLMSLSLYSILQCHLQMSWPTGEKTTTILN